MVLSLSQSLRVSLSLSGSLTSLSQRLQPTPPPASTSSAQADPSPKPPIHASDPRLRPVLHLNTHPMLTSLGFFGFRGFHCRSKLWVSLGFIVEAAATFLSPLLWFSADQTHLPQNHFSSVDQTYVDIVLLTEA